MALLKGSAEVTHVIYLPTGSVPHGAITSASSRVSLDASNSPWLQHSLSATSSTHDGEERPPKRRKVAVDCSVRTTSFAEDQSVILAKVSLDLVRVHIESSS